MEKFGIVRFNLEQQIKKAGISQSKLCQRAEVQSTQLKEYCKNKRTRIDLAVLGRLCTVLECDISDILEFVPASDESSDNE